MSDIAGLIRKCLETQTAPETPDEIKSRLPPGAASTNQIRAHLRSMDGVRAHEFYGSRTKYSLASKNFGPGNGAANGSVDKPRQPPAEREPAPATPPPPSSRGVDDTTRRPAPPAPNGTARKAAPTVADLLAEAEREPARSSGRGHVDLTEYMPVVHALKLKRLGWKDIGTWFKARNIGVGVTALPKHYREWMKQRRQTPQSAPAHHPV